MGLLLVAYYATGRAGPVPVWKHVSGLLFVGASAIRVTLALPNAAAYREADGTGRIEFDAPSVVGNCALKIARLLSKTPTLAVVTCISWVRFDHSGQLGDRAIEVTLCTVRGIVVSHVRSPLFSRSDFTHTPLYCAAA